MSKLFKQCPIVEEILIGRTAQTLKGEKISVHIDLHAVRHTVATRASRCGIVKDAPVPQLAIGQNRERHDHWPLLIRLTDVEGLLIR